jgi:hypothetical protein
MIPLSERNFSKGVRLLCLAPIFFKRRGITNGKQDDFECI